MESTSSIAERKRAFRCMQDFKSTSALRREKEEIAPATLDAERELADLHCATKTRQLHLSSVRQRERATDEAILSVDSKLETFLHGLRPAAMQLPTTPLHVVNSVPKSAALQPPALATYVANAASTTAAFQSPASTAHAARAASKPAVMQPAASALPAVKTAPNPAAMQPPVSSLPWVKVARGGKRSLIITHVEGCIVDVCGDQKSFWIWQTLR